MEKRVFGEVAAMIYVVEFQKRGLPHAHLLIILKPTYKITCPADFDKFVCAEIPSLSDPHLRAIILRHMMQGPCGHLNPHCPCMKRSENTDRCKYEYPKKFSAETTSNANGYPVYRRRDTGETVSIRKATLDNRWVIPYNPHLPSLFDCHLNVEVCSNIQAVKYLYKYVYKGHDKISFNVVQNEQHAPVDEIQQYQAGRWVSPCEAAWRIFGFDLFDMYPAVMPLQLHLPGMQTIQARPFERLESVVSDNRRCRTPLTEYFRTNALTPGGTGYLYREFPEHYWWDTCAREWVKRKNKRVVIGRKTFVAPAEGERYFLRLLLLHVRGPTSFNDLLTVNGYKCATFQDAALKLGLLEEDDASDLCLSEACEVKMPGTLRRLFSTVLIFCQPSDPGATWTKYYAAMSEDFRRHNPNSEEKVRTQTVREIENYLEAMGKSLQSFGLEHLNDFEDDEIRRTKDITDALDAPIPDEWVIPYNPHLPSLFDCHLNVEVCSNIQAVKYLYKYVYKGHDKISFNVVQNEQHAPVDEIQQYQAGRWVSPCEAAWRIFGFDLFDMYPAVMPLQLHLPGMQTIQARPFERLESVVSDNRRCRTPLTEYFRTNALTPGGTGYLYREFPEHYWWDTCAREWVKRKNKRVVIGRKTFVAPAEGERYFLRLLLLHVRGPTSFNDLLTVNGYKCATFQDAALKLGLLEEDDASDLCLSEACEVKMPGTLRRLFSTVLIFCQPSDPGATWTKYYAAMSEDFRRHNPNSEEKVRTQTVREIENYLEAMGKSLQSFGLEHLNDFEDDEIRRTKDITDALDAPIPDECLSCRDRLNTAQQEAFNVIIDHVKKGKPGAFFIDWPGGTEKTFFYNALYVEIRLMKKIVLPTATSGIAASNIPSGRTAHSRFKIPIDSTASLACDIPKQRSLAVLIKEAALIIWDEASMARKENVESLDSLLRDLCDTDVAFGGKLVVFDGDFR